MQLKDEGKLARKGQRKHAMDGKKTNKKANTTQRKVKLQRVLQKNTKETHRNRKERMTVKEKPTRSIFWKMKKLRTCT